MTVYRKDVKDGENMNKGIFYVAGDGSDARLPSKWKHSSQTNATGFCGSEVVIRLEHYSTHPTPTDLGEKTVEWIDVKDSEVVVGDTVIGWTTKDNGYHDSTHHLITRFSGRSMMYAVHAVDSILHDVGDSFMISMRVKLPRPGTTSSATPATSRWNGKCCRCGKGTYQGLFSLEHEGDCR